MNNEQQEMQIIPTDGIIATSHSVINIGAEEIEDAVVLDDIDPDNHPNFIESNTSAVTGRTTRAVVTSQAIHSRMRPH